MPLELALMEEDDIPAFAVVDTKAAVGWGLAKAMETSNPTPETRPEFVERWTREGWGKDSSQTWLKVTDSDLGGQMVAAALWRFQLDEEKPKQVNDVPAPAAEAGADSTKAMDAPKLSNPNVLEVMGKMWAEFKAEFVGTKPHANLQILVADPAHQRRGAGSMLVQWGCKKADDRGLMAVLTASEAGLRLYEKNGFKVVKETHLDLRPFGVDEVDIRRNMIRSPHADR